MIDSKELRIGNLVLFSSNSTIFKVTGVSEYGIDVEDEVEETYMEYDNFEPMPITEEWLLKINCDFEIKLDKKGGIILFQSYYHHINHLHQLQNLYFALTGNELIL